jgi:hypothetical protein
MVMVRSAPLIVVATVAWGEVLHERVTVGNLTCKDGVCTTGNGKPVAVDQKGELHPAPEDGVQPKPGEQIYTPKPERVEAGGAAAPPGEFPPERRDVIRPDRETGPEPPGKHYYHEVFDPTIFPYKRMTALDAVELGPCGTPAPGCEEERLVVRDPRLEEIHIGPGRGARDGFWGSIVVDLEPGKWLPIPTPGASPSILTARTEPEVFLRFARDSADNLYVQSPAGGRHRLLYRVESPSSYFGGELPAGVRLGDEPGELLPPMPISTQKRVRTFLQRAHIQADRNMPLGQVLNPLVAWFRAFETGDLPLSSGNSYLDLACSQKGCCRHRSYAFAVTAMSIGIPARYVENELHVFVEVYLPRIGWRRINLGGALLDEELLNADNKPAHQPRGGDPFPQPRQFNAGAEPPRPPPPSSESSASSSSSSGGSGPGSGPGVGGGKGGPESRDPGLPWVNLDEPPARAEPPRAHTSLTVELQTRDTFRGDTIEVTGRLRAEGADAGGLPVEIFLQGPSGGLRVGAATTDPDGSFRALIDIPRNLPLGDHRVVARTRGDGKRAPSRSR